jgi:hypothetical protein
MQEFCVSSRYLLLPSISFDDEENGRQRLLKMVSLPPYATGQDGSDDPTRWEKRVEPNETGVDLRVYHKGFGLTE